MIARSISILAIVVAVSSNAVAQPVSKPPKKPAPERVEKVEPKPEAAPATPATPPPDDLPMKLPFAENSEENKEKNKSIAAERRVQVSRAVHSGFTSGGSIASDALQAVAQVVLKRAVQAGWDQLDSLLQKLAHCDKSDSKLQKTCGVLKTSRVQDILATPKTLLDAFVSDVIAVAAKHPIFQAAFGASATLAFVVSGWSVGGSNSVISNIKERVRTQIIDEAGQIGCPNEPGLAAAWAIAECLATEPSSNFPIDLGQCEFSKAIDTCAFDDTQKSSVRQVLQLATRAMSPNSEGTGTNNDAAVWVQLFFEWAKLAANADQALLGNLESLFLGLVHHDWLEALQGLSAIATSAINTDKCDAEKCDIPDKLLKIVGAVGEYAETYSSNGKTDASTAAAAREKVIDDLVTGLVNRTGRTHGAVLSLGGALGGFAGARYNANGSEWAWPLRLTLGVGLDSYHARTVGFHASIDVFDLGQYVTYSKGDFDVGPPDVKSVISVGGTAGVWFLSRQTPMFVALHGGVSPFVKTQDGRMTYEIGAMLGIYVPLLDFN